MLEELAKTIQLQTAEVNGRTTKVWVQNGRRITLFRFCVIVNLAARKVFKPRGSQGGTVYSDPDPSYYYVDLKEGIYLRRELAAYLEYQAQQKAQEEAQES